MQNINKVKTVETLQVGLTPEKYAEVKQAASSTGLSASAFGRQAIYKELAAVKMQQAA